MIYIFSLLMQHRLPILSFAAASIFPQLLLKPVVQRSFLHVSFSRYLIILWLEGSTAWQCCHLGLEVGKRSAGMVVWYLFPMGARRHGQAGHLPPPRGNVVKFLCISSCKTLSGRIIYALFSQPVVSLWGLDPTVNPSLDPIGGFRPDP